MSRLLAIACLLFGLDAMASANNRQQGERTNVVDPRRNERWANNPAWADIVRVELTSGGFTFSCTGSFIAPSLILTAAHCIPQSTVWVTVRNIWNQTFLAYVVDRGQNKDFGPDWAILRVRDKYFFSSQYLNVAPGAQPLNAMVYNVGFGSMRKIDDRELPFIRSGFLAYLRSLGRQTSREAQIFSVKDAYADHLKGFENYLANHTIDGVRIAPLFNDGMQLKIDSSCRLIGRPENLGPQNNNNFVLGTCATVGGNSGGPAIDYSTGQLVGVVSAGVTLLGWQRDTAGSEAFPSMFAGVDLFNKLLPSLQTAAAPQFAEDKVFDGGEWLAVSVEFDSGLCWRVYRNLNGTYKKRKSLPVGTQC